MCASGRSGWSFTCADSPIQDALLHPQTVPSCLGNMDIWIYGCGTQVLMAGCSMSRNPDTVILPTELLLAPNDRKGYTERRLQVCVHLFCTMLKIWVRHGGRISLDCTDVTEHMTVRGHVPTRPTSILEQSSTSELGILTYAVCRWKENHPGYPRKEVL